MTSSLVNILDLEQLDTNLFRSRHHQENFRKTLFGGQVLCQALAANYQVHNSRLPNSLHAYFLRAGSSKDPVIYDVECVREGRSILSSRTIARQYGRPIFHLSASFHIQEKGFEHQIPMPPDVPLPDELLAKGAEVVDDGHIPSDESSQMTSSPIALLPVDPDDFYSNEPLKPESMFWMKARDTLPNSPFYHIGALAFTSDIGLLATSLMPHRTSVFDRKIFAASMDHAMWFHSAEFRADEWLLYKTFSPWAGSARGFSQANIFTQGGKLIASTAQEGLIRPS